MYAVAWARLTVPSRQFSALALMHVFCISRCFYCRLARLLLLHCCNAPNSTEGCSPSIPQRNCGPDKTWNEHHCSLNRDVGNFPCLVVFVAYRLLHAQSLLYFFPPHFILLCVKGIVSLETLTLLFTSRYTCVLYATDCRHFDVKLRNAQDNIWQDPFLSPSFVADS